MESMNIWILSGPLNGGNQLVEVKKEMKLSIVYLYKTPPTPLGPPLKWVFKN